jgi:prepilin peptidase CpaA
MPATTLLPVSALLALCAVAVAHDLMFRRIPNGLVLTGMALGLLFQILAPHGEGLLLGGNSGLADALLGGLVGLVLFLPLYALRTMGAGDVKMLAMVGIWLGPAGVAWTALWTLLAGGVLALAVALWCGVLQQAFRNMHTMWMVRSHGTPVDGPASTTGHLPYAVAIACGTAGELFRHNLLSSF